MHFRKTILSVSVSVIIVYIDYAFQENDIIGIGIGIGYNRLYRFGSGQQSVISIVILGETIISVSTSVIIGYID
jgi:hypothetical protein